MSIVAVELVLSLLLITTINNQQQQTQKQKQRCGQTHEKQRTMNHNKDADDESWTGLERSLMVKSLELKDLKHELRLYRSERNALEREKQTPHVLQRKVFLDDEMPHMEDRVLTLIVQLTKIMNNGGDQINPSGKYYILAEKLVK